MRIQSYNNKQIIGKLFDDFDNLSGAAQKYGGDNLGDVQKAMQSIDGASLSQYQYTSGLPEGIKIGTDNMTITAAPGHEISGFDGNKNVSAPYGGKETSFLLDGKPVTIYKKYFDGSIEYRSYTPQTYSNVGTGKNAVSQGELNSNGTITMNGRTLMMDNNGDLHDVATGDIYTGTAKNKILGTETAGPNQNNYEKIYKEYSGKYEESIKNDGQSIEPSTGQGDKAAAEAEVADPYDYEMEEQAQLREQVKGVTTDKLAASAAGDHLLQSGDTLWGFAEQSSQGEGEFHSVATLALLNGLTLTADGHVAEAFMAGVDSVDIEVNIDEVTSAKTSVDKVIEKIDELETNFNSLLSLYLQAYKTDSLPAEIEGIANEFSKNITVLKEDACAYSAWLNKVQESMTYDASNAGNMMGDPTIIAEITH